MSACDYSPYTLPTIEFVGGETQTLIFNTYFHNKDRAFGLESVTANFSVVSFNNKTGVPIISETMDALYNEDHTALNVLKVTIPSSKTLNLSGKYIYQISIRDIDDTVEIPKQGIMYIINNINKGFIQ